MHRGGMGTTGGGDPNCAILLGFFPAWRQGLSSMTASNVAAFIPGSAEGQGAFTREDVPGVLVRRGDPTRPARQWSGVAYGPMSAMKRTVGSFADVAACTKAAVPSSPACLAIAVRRIVPWITGLRDLFSTVTP